MSALTMASLPPGTRIRHIGWDLAGTIRQLGEVREIRFDGVLGEIEISDDGPVRPADVEILEGSR